MIFSHMKYNQPQEELSMDIGGEAKIHLTTRSEDNVDQSWKQERR